MVVTSPGASSLPLRNTWKTAPHGGAWRTRIVVRRKWGAGTTRGGPRRRSLHENHFDGAVAPEDVHADVLAVSAELEVDEAVSDAKVADPDGLQESRQPRVREADTLLGPVDGDPETRLEQHVHR